MRWRTASPAGTPNHDLIARDFSRAQRQRFSVTREIFRESDSASDSDAGRMERHFILAFRSNDPAIGYNRWPPFRPMS